ncbi:MAG TPA: nuclear transport factor 2 family protein, partial [Acidimicrobiales bacterium]|nr:nuclear transport factor 2 family protein [Acidimicrobiales bacterium]
PVEPAGPAPSDERAGGRSTADDPRVDILRRAYRLFNDKDVDGFVALLDPDIVWPDLSGGPSLRGAEAVRSYWRNAFSVVSARVVPHEFLVDDDAVIVVIEREVLDLQGHSLGSPAVVVHRVTFRDGRIAKLSITTSDLDTPKYVLDRFRAVHDISAGGGAATGAPRAD